MENPQVSNYGSCKNFGSCIDHFKVGLLQVIAIYAVSIVDKLQKVQNAAARVVVCCRKATHISPILKELHWLQVKYRIIFSVTVNVFKALNGHSPQYIKNMLSFETKSKITSLSGMGLLMIPKWNNKTCGKKGFSVAGPIEWNKLPLYISF